MQTKQSLGLVVLAFAVLLLVEAMVLLFTGDAFLPPTIRADRDVLGMVYGVCGLILVLAGGVLQSPDRRSFQYHSRQVVQREVEFAGPVDIKRTRMDFAFFEANATTGPFDKAVESDLDTVSRKLGALRVRYGLGEVGKTTYERLANALEADKARLELQLYAAGPTAP